MKKERILWLFEEEHVMKKMIHLTKVLTAVLAVLMMITMAPSKISAEDPTVGEYEHAVSSKVFYEFELDKDKYDEERSTIPTKLTLGNPGDVFTAYYPDCLKYFDGSYKSIKVEVTYLGYNRYKEAGDIAEEKGYERGIRLDENDIRLGALGVDYNVKYSFYDDSEFTTSANIYGVVAFEDPDLSNYWFDGANTRKMYYIDAKDKKTGKTKLSNKYYVTADGIVHVDQNDKEYGSWPDFNDGTFGILLNNESTFSFRVEGKHDKLYLLTRIIKVDVSYKVEYYYETADGYPEEPDYTSEDRIVDIYENPIVSVTNEDKTPNPEMGAGYSLDELKNAEWELELQEDGSTVLKVYFNMGYKIKYNKNAKDATGEMADNDYTKSAPTMPSEKDWTFERPGYEFIGYKIENSGETFTDPQDFKEYLLGQEDREVELFAQWNPLDYHIKYNKNAEDATGVMETDDYLGSDENMPSKEEWTFERRGYELVGFKIENEGDIYPADSKEFKEYLLKEQDREVELYAQWNPLPYKIKYNKNAEDATGEMKDDDYLGSDETMPSKEEWTFEREGYDFTGFKLENKGELLNGSKEYKEVLLDEEDREIELFAQWDPWKYTIRYFKNAEDATGEMPDSNFVYPDPEMVSDPNKFSRKGWKFIGFEYTDPDGKVTLYKDINDFRDEFMKLGKNSVIDLYAQWKRIPKKAESTNYIPPVTGD